jgi:REP element-mobilizing transposase RayT
MPAEAGKPGGKSGLARYSGHGLGLGFNGFGYNPGMNTGRGTVMSSQTRHRTWNGRHRFEHWYRDHQAYFITARCRDRYLAFASEPAKAVFWDRLAHHAGAAGFELWIASLLDNHYHLIGCTSRGDALGTMMQRLHGSVAKLVNDLLPQRRKPFWRDEGYRDYYDGCLRDEKQLTLTYQYTRLQAVRAGLVRHWRDYPHTHVHIEIEEALRRAVARDALLKGVPYKRYLDRGGKPGGHAR